MPNIIIIGLKKKEAIKIRRKIDDELARMAIEGGAITTIISALTQCCDSFEQAPYLIVRGTNIDELVQIAKAMNENLHMDVELEQITAFMEHAQE